MTRPGDSGGDKESDNPSDSHCHKSQTDISGPETEFVSLVVRHADGETTLTVRRGRVLRDVLREHGLSPYTRVTERANCGGRGICATCGVRLRVGPSPTHWHDRLADRFGYPRLSCQVHVEEGMVVELDEEKVVWGRRESKE